MNKLPNLTRRNFLRGLSGAALSLPYLESFAAVNTAPPVRMAFFYLPNGLVRRGFFPGESGAELPKFANQIDISFPHPEHFSEAFSRDIIGLKDNHIWEFVTSTDGTNKIAGTRTYDNTQKKITFSPALALSPYTVYTAYCTTNIKTVLGTSLSNNIKWQFKSLPSVSSNDLALLPLQSDTNISLNPVISVTFTTNLQNKQEALTQGALSLNGVGNTEIAKKPVLIAF